MTPEKDVFEAQMAVIRQRFAQRLAEDETSLRVALKTFLYAPSDCSCRTLRSIAHKLSGSAGLLGYVAIGGTAAQLDDKASAMLDGEPCEGREVAEAACALLNAIGVHLIVPP